METSATRGWRSVRAREAVAGGLGDGEAEQFAVARDGDAAFDDDRAFTDERHGLVDAQVADVAAGAHNDARSRLGGGERVATEA